jgi:hypothetical protein
MSVCKYRAFIFLDQPPPWVSRTLIAAYSLGEEETAYERTLESLVKRASKPNKKITTASWLLPVHGLLSNVFGIELVSLGTHESFNYKTGDMATLPDVIFPSLIIYCLWCGDSNVDIASIIRNGARDLQSNKLLTDISDLGACGQLLVYRRHIFSCFRCPSMVKWEEPKLIRKAAIVLFLFRIMMECCHLLPGSRTHTTPRYPDKDY